jgi:hypothetical protein
MESFPLELARRLWPALHRIDSRKKPMKDFSGDKLTEEEMKAFVEFDPRLHGKGWFPTTQFRVSFDTVKVRSAWS